ncbi:somatomedin-B and thrombospondin type-1 domain-containing protein [Coregonus clupeaformis]|uniref:somatomedin-B and thrombospondin type-1 domain-containing protein n=1 Tax=Coregonus clupeaformis TaxID=59861 RepID=UPI001BDFFACF|nr:somatomedin-B and thrombospondin type-1 domain-containing protein [Coregonus clupeaformis]
MLCVWELKLWYCCHGFVIMDVVFAVPALITTGDYGNARKKRDIPDNDDVQGYCVQFQLTSLTPGCQRSVGPHTRWMQYLKEGHQVCVECQPPALAAGQTHCSGDGDKDEEESGRQSLQWQAVGNPRCRGVWRRVGRLDSCSCPTIHSFGQTGQHMDQA